MTKTTSAFHPLAYTAALALALAGCATETHRTVAPTAVASAGTAYSGPKHTLVVGKFQNRSTYMQGIFSEGPDQLGNQSKTILKSHLQQSGRFTVVDRENMQEIAEEAKLAGAARSGWGSRGWRAGGGADRAQWADELSDVSV